MSAPITVTFVQVSAEGRRNCTVDRVSLVQMLQRHWPELGPDNVSKEIQGSFYLALPEPKMAESMLWILDDLDAKAEIVDLRPLPTSVLVKLSLSISADLAKQIAPLV